MRIRSAFLPILAAIALTLPAAADNHAKVKSKNNQAMIIPEFERLPGHEPDTYRYGTILAAMRGVSPRVCEITCNQNRACSAWTFLPATFEHGPVCEVKATIGTQSHRPGAFSGLALRYQPGSPRLPAPPKMTPITRPKLKAPPVRSQRPPSSDALMGGPKAPMTRQVMPKTAAPVRAPGPVPVPRPAPRPAAAPAPKRVQQPAVLKQAPRPAPVAQTRKAPPSPPGPAQTRERPQFRMAPAPAPTAVSAPPPVAQPAPAPAPQPLARAPQQPQPVQSTAPTVGRKPWTERKTGEPGYSVSGMDYIPGDEEATAGYSGEFVGGAQ